MRKRLSDLHLMSQETETISMMEFRASPGDVLDQVLLGKTFVITRQGKEIAVLQKLPGHNMTAHVNPQGKVSYQP